MGDFKLIHEDGKLFVEVTVDDVTYRKDVTAYFLNDNAHDDWLDYRLGLNN